MRRFFIPGLIAVAAVAVLALLTFGVASHSDAGSLDSRVQSGRFPPAPDADRALQLLDSSQKRTLADYRGKVVVLNVFASWCPPCAAEAPLLAREQHLLARHDATLIGVTYEDAASSSAGFARQYHLTYPILRDVSGSFASAYGVNGVPETFVINRQGRIQALTRVPVTSAWLNQTLPAILAGKT